MNPLSIAALLYLAVAHSHPGASAVANAADSAHATSLRGRLATTLTLFRAARYQEAEEQTKQLIADAVRAGDLRTATRAMGNLGGLRFALHQYQGARTALLEARSMAVAADDASETAALDANLASLYMDMGDLEEAGRRFERVLERLSGKERADHVAETQILLAQLRAGQGRMAQALMLFSEGITAAESTGDWKLAAIAWNHIGEEYLRQGDLGRAEPPLLEAFRIRAIRHLALDTSYLNLGRLRLEQGDLKSAERFLDRAIELGADPQGPIPSWDAYHYRGRLRIAQGRLTEGLADLRIAVRLAHAWRWSAPPDDGIRSEAEGWLDRVYSALIDAGNRLYEKNGEPDLIRETFEAEEENRASSLRVMIEGRIAAAEAMPAAYWPAVSRLQQAEVNAARFATPAAEQEALSARADLAQIEFGQFHQLPGSEEGLLARLQANLGSGTALLAFHLGDAASWMWAVDRDRIFLCSLPGRQILEGLARSFSEDVESASPAMTSTGARLYSSLFGALPREFREKSRWLLALNDSLFRIPFAALPAPDGRALSELREIEIVPSAALWSKESRRETGIFLGVGDAVYNQADPRRVRTWRASPIQLTSLSALPRMAGSALELRLSAWAWNGESKLLEGSEASRTSLAAALGAHPRVIHFATHFVPAPGRADHAAIALSLGASGTPETLDPAEIAGWRVNASLVALSGCDSSAGSILPGSGLLGLTRAWLAAGARAVLATYWPISDDGAPFFAAFYSRLSRGESPSTALREAQMEMAASGGRRAKPRYWAAYFLMGRE